MTQSVSVILSEDLGERVSRAAATVGVSVTEFVESVLIQYVSDSAEYDWGEEPTAEACVQAEAEADRLNAWVSWEHVQPWLRSLGTEHELPLPE